MREIESEQVSWSWHWRSF